MSTAHTHTSRPARVDKDPLQLRGNQVLLPHSGSDAHLSRGTAPLYRDGLESLFCIQPLWYLLGRKVMGVGGRGGHVFVRRGWRGGKKVEVRAKGGRLTGSRKKFTSCFARAWSLCGFLTTYVSLLLFIYSSEDKKERVWTIWMPESYDLFLL